jgi:MFS family permease
MCSGGLFGRKRLQMASFTICAGLFMATASIFDRSSPLVLMLLYFLSSFFGNFGTNVTTYVMAAETYATEIRGTCHGLSAFLGKCGALLATILFSKLSVVLIFWVCGAVSVMGLVFTYIFSVDLTHVSLAEHDAQLELFFEGRPEQYKGRLNAKEHLSNWEVWTGRHGEFDPNWASKLIAESKNRKAEEGEQQEKPRSSASSILHGSY